MGTLDERENTKHLPPGVVRVLSNGKRLYRESLQVDGGSFSSPGRCYLHLQDFQNERAHSIAWGALKKAMSDQNRAPEGVSTDQILQAMRLLGFAEPKLSKGP